MSKANGIFAAVLALLFTASSANGQTFVRMVSGPAGGSWYPLGAKIMEVLEREVADISTSNGPGGGVGNVRDVDARNAELGWTFGFTAYQGRTAGGAFDKEHENIRHLASLYTGVLQTATPRDSDIRSYKDLEGRNVCPGQTFFSGYQMFEHILRYYGLSVDAIRKAGGTVHNVSFSDCVALMKDGHIEAYTAAVEVPHSTMIDLNFSVGIRLLPIEDDVIGRLLDDNPGYVRATVSSDVYDGFESDVATIGAPVTLIVHKDVPEDLVYRMTSALWDNRDEMVEVKEIWKNVRLQTALNGAAIPVHPGAERYYEEKGVSQ